MEPNIDFSRSADAWSRDLILYADLADKELEDALNRKGKDVIIRTIQATPRADPAAIRASLQRDGLAFKLIRKEGLNRRQIATKARRFISKSVSSARYIVAGFYNILAVLGGRAGRTKQGGLAEASTGSKATEKNLKVEFVNRTVGAPQVAGDALAHGIESSRADMMIYIQRKLAKLWERR